MQNSSIRVQYLYDLSTANAMLLRKYTDRLVFLNTIAISILVQRYQDADEDARATELACA
jgi:hypothetical protein